MVKIAYVILHYKVFDVTEECVDFLVKQDYSDHEIIIVDNFSNNGSLEKLQKKYVTVENVFIVGMEKNYGFAKANDVGYQVAKHKFNAECIIIMNNDVMIEDVFFSQYLSAINSDMEYDIMGPNIVNKMGEHQNPLQGCIKDEKELKMAINNTRMRLFLVPWLYGLLYKEKTITENTDFQEDMEYGVPLHGSCMIFGKNFISKHEFAFYPETFLYGEEDILFFLARRENLKLLYNPKIKVHHMEDVSTNSVTRNSKEKRLFELRNSLNSLKILQRLMNEK